MTTRWVDSHCHLQEQFLPGESEAEAVAHLAAAATASVDAVVCVGTDEVTSNQAVALATAARTGALGAGLPIVRAVVGLHPHDATSEFDWIEPLLSASPTDVVGVGECGLDYFYENAPKPEQRIAFAAQIALAHAHDLALVIHARDAWDDLFDVLGSEGVPTETVLHCFTGGPAEAARCVEMGLSVSFSGIITFKTAQDIRDAAAEVPLTSVLVETDSPFLAPVPHRGRPNEPALVPLVGAAVAAAKGVAIEELAASSTANARRIFRF